MIPGLVIRWRRKTHRYGWIKKIPPATSVTNDSRSASACCLSSSGRTWAKAFHSPAKTGPVRKRPIDSSQTTTSVSRTYLGGHFQATSDRFAHAAGPILILQDTTTFSYQRDRPERIGFIGKSGNLTKPLTQCGILMHSSLAVTTQGVPLGLAAIKFWTRSKFRSCNALKKTINPTRVPIEEKESYRWLENLRQSTELFGDPQRCVHIGDRERDIYELFCTAQDVGTHFLVRTCVDRLAGDGGHTIAQEMEEVKLKGLHRVRTSDAKGNVVDAVLEIRYRRINVLPPIVSKAAIPLFP